MRRFLFLATASVLWAASSVMAQPPNIVLIISDDQAWTDYSFMAHPAIKTPQLDKLASQSLVFSRGYVPSSLCRASLATIVTGLYPHQHKITSNDPPLPLGKTGRAARRDPIFLAKRKEMINYIDQSPTLPRLLAKKGYVSFQTGKWWEGSHKRGGFTDGMTHGDPKRGARHGDAGLKISRQGNQPIYDFIERARADDKPFFIWHAPFMPHSPHTPPERLFQKYKRKTDSQYVARYWAMCEWFDETCGELLGYLDQKGLADNTLVIYVTDNGWIQRPDRGGFAPRSKQSPNEGGIRTPIMLRWPGHTQPERVDELAISIDLAPTILAAAGLEPVPDMKGVDLLDRKAVKDRKVIFGEIFEHNAVDLHNPVSSLKYRWCIARSGQGPKAGLYKLILPNGRNPNVRGDQVQLYELMGDPHESEDLASGQPDRTSRMRRLINQWWPAQSQSQ